MALICVTAGADTATAQPYIIMNDGHYLCIGHLTDAGGFCRRGMGSYLNSLSHRVRNQTTNNALWRRNVNGASSFAPMKVKDDGLQGQEAHQTWRESLGKRIISVQPY